VIKKDERSLGRDPSHIKTYGSEQHPGNHPQLSTIVIDFHIIFRKYY